MCKWTKTNFLQVCHHMHTTNKLDCQISHVCHTMDPILDLILGFDSKNNINFKFFDPSFGLSYLALFIFLFSNILFLFIKLFFFWVGLLTVMGFQVVPLFIRPRLGKLFNGNLPPLAFGPPPISNWGVVLQTHSPCGLSPSFKGKSGVQCNILCFRCSTFVFTTWHNSSTQALSSFSSLTFRQLFNQLFGHHFFPLCYLVLGFWH